MILTFFILYTMNIFLNILFRLVLFMLYYNLINCDISLAKLLVWNLFYYILKIFIKNIFSFPNCLYLINMFFFLFTVFATKLVAKRITASNQELFYLNTMLKVNKLDLFLNLILEFNLIQLYIIKITLNYLKQLQFSNYSKCGI